jgi:hypothetical protein
MLAQLSGDSADISLPLVRDHFDFREALRQISYDLPSSQRVVVLLDEVGTLPPAISERFFSAVRTIFNEREPFPEFRRYIFVMAGSFIPDELVQEPSIMPFNIASRLYTSDADREGLAGLVRNLERVGYAVSDEVIDRIYYWTGGHLYLTQRLCSVLHRRREAHLAPQLVDAAIDDVLGDRNIRRVYDRLDGSPEERETLRRILDGDEPLRFNRASRNLARLELMGVIKPNARGYCTVRNAIYEKALTNGHLDCNTGEAEELTRLEHKLFQYFSENTMRTCSYDEVAEAVWGDGILAEQGIDGRIYQLVARLRRKMALDPSSSLRIITVRGRGYKPQWRG